MARRRTWWMLSRAEWLAAAAVLMATAFVVQPLFAQQASRMALTASIAEHGTVRIDRFEGGALGVDFAEKDGHLYSDKAPAQPVLAVAPYLAYKAVGGESAQVLRTERNLGLWWISVWSAALPAAVLVVVMARLARPWNPRFALPAAVAMAFGSLLLPFGTLLFSHTASAALVAGALLVWRGSTPTRRDLLVTGALLGAAVSVEYTGVVALAVVGLASVVRDRWSARWVALGAAVPLAAVAGYHWVAFGGPLEVPYRYHNLGLHDSAAAGLTAPTPARLWAMVSAERGLFALTPLILVALVGLVVAARDRPDRRWEVGVVAAVFAGFVIVQAGAADLTGGDSLGPRYVIPGLPALVIGLAVLWSRAPRLCAAAALVSTVFMTLGTYTDPMVSVEGGGVVSHWLDLVSSGEVADTLLDPLLGGAAIPVVLAGAAALVTASLRGGAADSVSRRRAARA